MNKRELADRFSSDVDHLLREAGLTDPKPDTPEYDDMLDVARKLATTDFSSDSRIRYSLRRRLLSRADPAPVTSAEIPGPISLIRQFFKRGQLKQGPFFRLRKNRIPLTAGVVIVFAFIALLFVSGLPIRQKAAELLAQVLAYLSVDQEPSAHTLSLRWQFRGNGGISSPPAAAQGLIYVGSNDGFLYALDARTGQEIWRFKTGGEINLAPTVAAEVVYVVSSDGYLYALGSQSGRELWRFQGDARFSFGPVMAVNTILVGAVDGSLYALDAGSAQQKWRFQAGNAILPEATVAGDTLYVGSQDHYLYALALETGREKWRFDAGNWLSTAPIEVAGQVYVGSHDENLYVLDAEIGREQQRYYLTNKAVRTSATLAGDTIYFGSYDSYLHAVDGATGEELWRFKMSKQTRSVPIVVDGVVYIGGGDGYLYEVNTRTGVEIARYGIDSQIYTAPAVLGDTIYFVSGKGELYAVQQTAAEQPETNLATPAENESPGFQITPGGWYVAGKDDVIHFRGRIVDGAGRPVNGVSIQADNGSATLLSLPGGPNRWRPEAKAGEWEIVVPADQSGTGWWWLTAVRDECAAGATDFDPQCRILSRLSESVKVQTVYPDEMVINADWTCQWNCQNMGEK